MNKYNILMDATLLIVRWIGTTKHGGWGHVFLGRVFENAVQNGLKLHF